MFFFLSKILYIFTSPLFWLVIWAIWAYFTKNPKLKKRLWYSFFVVCFVLNNTYLANTAMWYWEIQPTPLVNLQKEPYEVGIVLTGITRYKKTPDDRTYFDTGADRLIHAIMLYRKGHIKKILITGGTISAFGKKYKSEAMRLAEVLEYAQIPKEDIIIEENARNTRENALFSKEILEKKFPKNTKYMVITSAFHLRRALGCFEKVGLNVTGFSAGVLTNDVTSPSIDFFLLSTRAIHLWEILIHEMIGYTVYKITKYS